MAVTGTYTVRDIIEQAARKVGLISRGEAMPGEDFRDAMVALNVMLKSWQNRDIDIWVRSSQTVTLTTAASYTLDPARPLSVESARLVSGGVETPMIKLTRQEYDALPVKTVQGLPTNFYYDRQIDSPLFYVWPVLASANGQTVNLTFTREIEDIDSGSQVIPVPGEWWEAVVYNLASRLADDNSLNGPDIDRVIGRAQALYAEAEAFDREGSVFWGDHAPS